MPTYRTSDPARWGAGKEANLTAGEIDANFWELAERIAGVEGNAPEPNNIASITVVGTQMTIHLQDGTTLGPYTLPSAMIHFRGDWIAGTAYVEMDIVAAPDARGLYLVRRAHTAPAAFDPTATDASGNLLYRWVLPMTGSRLGDLSDVSLMAPADGQYLGWNGSTWLPRDVAASLSGLQDVLIGTLADGEVLTWDAASGIWVNAAPSGGGGAAQHRWRLVLRETFAAGTWFNPAEIEFRETAGVARSGTDGAPFTDPNTTWWSPENAFDGNLTNYVSGDAPASGAYIGVGFPVYMTFVEVAIKVYNCTLDDFDIQHSTDGLLWETLAQVRGAGITSGTSVSAWYTFALAAPATGGGGGAATFLELTDTPAAYGAAGQLAAMNGAGDGLVFIDPPTGGGLADAPADGVTYGRLNGAWSALDITVSWGEILDKPATFPPGAHTHPWGDVTGKPATVVALPAAVGTDGQVLKASGGAIVWAADEVGTGDGGGGAVIEDITGTAYTAAAADAGKWKRTTDATAVTITIDANVHSANDEITFLQGGAGAMTFAAGAGLTLNSRGGVLPSAGQFAVCGVKFLSATAAILFGDIA